MNGFIWFIVITLAIIVGSVAISPIAAVFGTILFAVVKS